MRTVQRLVRSLGWWGMSAASISERALAGRTAMHKILATTFALPLLLGTCATPDDASALEKFAGAEEAITSYYAANAREGAGNCGVVRMTEIGDARVVSESGDQAVVAVDYGFSATVLGSNAAICSGAGEREFTLSKAGSGWTVTGMTGEAR
jgi:hypothetical protein